MVRASISNSIARSGGVKKLKRGLETMILERESLTGLGFSVDLTPAFETETEKQDLSRVRRSNHHSDFESVYEKSGIFRFRPRVDTIEADQRMQRGCHPTPS